MRRDLNAFLAHPFPQVTKLLGAWLPERGLVMVAGYRGVGKTWCSLGIGCAVASATPWLGFEAPAARGVLLVDGEMDPAELQGRLKAVREGLPPAARSLAGSNFRIITHADYEDGIPNLADVERGGRRLVEECAEDCALIILDNLSTLCGTGDENSSAEWQSMQDWLVRLRRLGKAVLLIHHGGKPSGENGYSRQRGTSRREDVLNTSVMLQRPQGMSRDRFEWHWSKTRGWVPEQDEMTVRIRLEGGAAALEICTAEAGAQHDDDAKELAEFLKGEGYSLREIEARTRIPKSTVARMFKQEVE